MARVIVVDDFEPNLQLYVALVQRELGELPAAFEDPAEALQFLKLQRPRLIIVDYQMPEMDGISFVRAVRALEGYADTPLVMLTAVSDPVVRAQALTAGATQYMEKPFALREFAELVRRYAGSANVTTGAVPRDLRRTRSAPGLPHFDGR
ncbi:MAG TPA: response regulator [Candidatus Baltobacteraceae bacterium]|jgi:putative two-component system response regulator|nr:response regulator [Candidatus Baltobacteraceae bacterium]